MNHHEIATALAAIEEELTNEDGTVHAVNALVLSRVKALRTRVLASADTADPNRSLKGIAEKAQCDADFARGELMRAKGELSEARNTINKLVSRDDHPIRFFRSLPAGSRLILELPPSLRVVGEDCEGDPDDGEDCDDT
jgi:hypothetical protein